MACSMSNNIDGQKINMEIAQIQSALQSNRIAYRNDTKWLLGKVKNINGQVVATNYLQAKHTDWIGNTALHFAADKGDLEVFEILLNHGADFTISNSSGLTALHLIMQDIANSNSTTYQLENPVVSSVISAHLQSNNFNNPLSDYGLSHFHVACAANNVEAVKGFLQSGVSIDQAVKTDSPIFPGFTSLHFAAKYCAFEVTRLLLSHGANVQNKDAKSMTPLHIALKKKFEVSVDIHSDETERDTCDKILLLLSNKSNNGTITTDDWGLSNFHVCCALEDSKIADSFFLLKGVNINHTVNMDSSHWAGFNALHFAALCNVDLVILLMKRGGDISMKDAKGVTPFDMCIERYENDNIYRIILLNPVWKNIVLSDGKTKLLNLIFEMINCKRITVFPEKISKDINIPKDSTFWPGCSPLHLAVIFCKINGKSEQRNLLIFVIQKICQENPSMLFTQDIHGDTPLHLAFRLNKELQIIHALVECLNNSTKLADRIDKDGLSFVHIASALNITDLLESILKLGADVNTIYNGKSQQFSRMICQGSTALHFAVANENKEAVDILIKYGADVYAKDANDMTPIHLLLLTSNSEADKQVADILLSTPNLKDSVVNGIGLSHLHVACCYEKPDVAERLLDAGADINLQITHQQQVNAHANIVALTETHKDQSPLIVAFAHENIETLKLLLARGADIFVEFDQKLTLYRVLDDCEFRIEAESFSAIVRSNEALMSRVQAETGMTSLHLACFDLNSELIEKAIIEGENVNAQISSFSPILKGDTALHIVMKVSKLHRCNGVSEIIDLLLMAGADVTLQNVKSETAIQLAYYSFADIDTENEMEIILYSHINALLDAQRDFKINPINDEGISHFHIACHVCNVNIVEKFLNNGDIDINQCSDYFSDTTAGCSALHLATQIKICGLQRHLDTIDLLLNHGADTHKEDSFGNTPFHDCIQFNSVVLFERLARSGGDVNARNINGKTPIYYYIKPDEEQDDESEEEPNKKSNKISLEEIKALIRLGCRLNTFCALTHEGYLGQIINVLSYKDVQNLLSVLIGEFEREMQIDDLGRTAIHNIVSIESPKISVDECTSLIEQLSLAGCDIDDQDNLGRTALHLAVKFYNFKAVSGLLLAGADINIVDRNGKTALACDLVDSCEVCEDIDDDDDDDDDEEIGCQHANTFKTLKLYVTKLKWCKLDVHKVNEDFTPQAYENLRIASSFTDKFFNELETVKQIKIEPHALTLDDFLSEYGAVVDYPRMSEIKRNDVNQFFSSDGAQRLREQFPALAEILQLQYRKAKARSNLLELAKNSLKALTGFQLPEICSELIFIFLKNSELKNLIASTSST